MGDSWAIRWPVFAALSGRSTEVIRDAIHGRAAVTLRLRASSACPVLSCEVGRIGQVVSSGFLCGGPMSRIGQGQSTLVDDNRTRAPNAMMMTMKATKETPRNWFTKLTGLLLGLS